MAVLRKVLQLEEYITDTQFKALGYLLGAFTLIMIYFNLQEFVVTGYKMEDGVPFHFEQLMLGSLAPQFWFYIVGGMVVPGLLILLPHTRTIPGIVTAAVLVIVGMWLERDLIVVGGFSVPLLAYDPATYAPSWVELSILAGAFALFALIVTVFAKLFPVVSVWEVVEHRGPEPIAAVQPIRPPVRVPDHVQAEGSRA
jgi:molybdopterin-containing oxidoreductase family membrane subunit